MKKLKRLTWPYRKKAKLRLARSSKELKPLRRPERIRNGSYVKLSEIVTDKKVILLLSELIPLPQRKRYVKFKFRTDVKIKMYLKSVVLTIT